MRRHRPVSLSYDTLRLEGALILPDVLEKAAQGNAAFQSEADYQTPKGFTLQEEYARAFRIAQAQWKAFVATVGRKDLDAAVATRHFIEEFLRDALSYTDLKWVGTVGLPERRFPIDAIAAGCVALVIAPNDLDLDEPSHRFVPEGGTARKKSAFQLAQEFVDSSPDYVWALVSNGRRIRLLREALSLTRPSFLEFDLETILAEARYPDFAALWRLLHASRARFTGTGGETLWDAWRVEGQREGARVREGLSESVTRALAILGEGFLQHTANESLRRALIDGTVAKVAYFSQLLRLIYRCIFLFAVEERGLLQPRSAARANAPEVIAARRIYDEGYSASRLRDRCLRRAAYDSHDDLWQALTIVFRGLAEGEPRLDLPALGGLFAVDQCPDLDAASLNNRALLGVMRELRWSKQSGTLAPVDYRNMGPEELGSVYESLLGMVPDPDPHARRFSFVEPDGQGGSQGNERKKSGSYYTPDSLVLELVRSALDPVIEAHIEARSEEPTDALLSIAVIDPACGSGHFLLAAARRLAERLAQSRAGEGPIEAEDYRHALREVITHSIYGVDRNPMALELARFALWLEGFEEGRPLGFLDHHLVCGDALIGITDVDQLTYGIPDVAFKPLSGDDKAVCKELAEENKIGLKTFGKLRSDSNIALPLERDSLLAERAALDAMPDETLEQGRAKQNAWSAYAIHERGSRLAQAADLFIGSFLASKAEVEALDLTPTSRNLYFALYTNQAPKELATVMHTERIAHAQKVASDAHALHWPLVFPKVFAKGGFDCVLTNPPWERIKLQEEEFFANENRYVSKAKNKSERTQRIEWLSQGMLARHLYPELDHPPDEAEKETQSYAKFIAARRLAEAVSVFAHLKAEEGGRYPLTGVGDVNTYALFAETIDQVVRPSGRAGFIVPTGIATDDSTKVFFTSLIRKKGLVRLASFYEVRRWFPATDERKPFCLMTLGHAPVPRFIFDIKMIEDLALDEKWYELRAGDFERINPNTLTLPTFRAKSDAALTKKIYSRVPVLVREARNGIPETNPWGVRFMTMFHMSNDSHLFGDHNGKDRLPLYEAKMIHQFDHRWATYRIEDGRDVPEDVPLVCKQDPDFTVRPRYWVEAREVYLRIASLPAGLLEALRETDSRSVVQAMSHLLFGKWLLAYGLTSGHAAVKRIFPAWLEFLEDYPFARATAPTKLGLCSDRRAYPKPLGPDYLPAEPVDQIEGNARGGAAWYPAEATAVSSLLKTVTEIPVQITRGLKLETEGDAVDLAERWLKEAAPKWFMGFRDITNAAAERTVIASALPRAAVGNNLPLMLFDGAYTARHYAALLGNLSALVLDFVGRGKVGGTHLNFFVAKQLPVLSPSTYSETDLAFVVPRILELTYTANDLKPWAQDLGFEDRPFTFDPDRRARLRAELDAWYAQLYGLNREDLCYVLDPASVMGEGYPSETFRVLKNNEEKEFGEYRTQRLTLEAWDAMVRGELS